MKQMHHPFGPALVLALSLFLTTTPARGELKIGGFTDFSFSATDDEAAASRSGFEEGQFVLHLNSSLDDRTFFFAELTWSPRSTGFGTEVERAFLKHTLRDALKLSAGRYHTAVSWWNVAYHHGTWLQTSVDRPLAARFGSKFLPIHYVGVMAEGNLFPGGLTVGYAAGVGNGRAENVARAGDAGDVNNERAVLLQLSLRHSDVYDLEIGGSVYLDRFPIEGGPDVDEQIFSAFVVLTRETPEILAEYFLVRHDDELTGQQTDNTSYYVQAAYRLPVLDERLKPYVRFEEIDIDGDDRGFQGEVPDLERLVAGLRIDVLSRAAIKVEGRRYRENDAEYVNELYTSLGLAF